MTVEQVINSWLPLVGGLSGAAMAGYFAWVFYRERAKDREMRELRLEVREIKGLLQGLLRYRK